MAKINMSEYNYSEYEKYLSLRRNTKGLILDYSRCSVSFNEDEKTVCLYIDPYFARKYEEENGRGPGIYTVDEILAQFEDSKHLDDDDFEESSADEELANLCKRFKVHFRDEVGEDEDIPRHYDHEYYANALSGSRVHYNLGEGLLDFFYFDINKHISSLKIMYMLMSMETKQMLAEIDGKEAPKEQEISFKNFDEREEYIYDRWKNTNDFCRDFFYSSLYTAAFTPIMMDAERQTLNRYVNYIKILQKEFQEKLTFCFDSDFYPSVLGHLYPSERYRIYCELYKEIPIIHTRKEEFTVAKKADSEEKMPFGCNEKFILDRLSTNIDTNSAEYKDFEEKYLHGHRIVDVEFKFPTCISVTYSCSSIFEMLNLEFTKMLEANIKLRKCKRCGKYFIMKGNYDTNYCDRIAEGQTRSCQDLAAQENYKAKAAENPALAIYSKYYKRYAARVRSRQIKEPDFKKWKFQALSKRDECSDGKITIEEYVAWMEGCFPNRTPKN